MPNQFSRSEWVWLNNRILWGMKVGLENMQVMCERLGQPQRSFRCVLVAGTNGKGSTASLLAHLLGEYTDLSIGLYTSPHLISVQERIKIGADFIPFDKLCAYLRQLIDLSTDRQLTFFETITLVALMHFAVEKVDWAILEVGLGGRLDSTNIVDAEMAILSSIGLDHTEILGTTHSQILDEKMGILRPGQKVCSAITQSDLQEILRQKCSELNAELYQIDEITDLSKLPITLPWTTATFDLHLGQEARLRNTILALTAFHQLYPQAWEEQILSSCQNHQWTGRWQWLQVPKGSIFIDGAHNADGARELAQEICRQNLQGLPLVVGMVGDKDAQAWFEQLRPWVGTIYLCRGQSERFRDPQSLVPFAGHNYIIAQDLHEAMNLAWTQNSRILLSGSLYLVGQAIEQLCEECPELNAYRALKPSNNERAPKMI